MTRPSTHQHYRQLGALLCVAALASCGESPTEAPTVTATVQLARGGNGPSINAADPATAPQDLTLDVRVLGSGFDRGSSAKWLIQGVPAEDVATNSTVYVSGSELVANITIAATASVELYDIEVTTRKGKKGVGVELFTVEEGGNGNPHDDATAATITLSGGIVTTGEDGQFGTNTAELLQLSGQPHAPGSSCTAPGDSDCFWSELSLLQGVEAAGGAGQCQKPRRMSNGHRDQLLGKLEDPAQARWIFELEYDRAGGSARLRTDWYEPDNPDGRYTYFLDSSDVTETGGPGQADWELVFTGGVVTMFGLGDKALTCDWQDSITLAIGPAP